MGKTAGCFTLIVSLRVMWLFLTGPWVGLQCVIVVFADHTNCFDRVVPRLLLWLSF